MATEHEGEFDGQGQHCFDDPKSEGYKLEAVSGPLASFEKKGGSIQLHVSQLYNMVGNRDKPAGGVPCIPDVYDGILPFAHVCRSWRATQQRAGAMRSRVSGFVGAAASPSLMEWAVSVGLPLAGGSYGCVKQRARSAAAGD